MICVLIVSGIRLYREGLAEVLARIEPLQVVGQCSDNESTLARVRHGDVDVVILDMSTPEGHALARDVRVTASTLPIVALGISGSEADVIACVEAGATGYVTRDESLEDLVAAVQGTVRGELLCSPYIAGSLVRRLAVLAANRGSAEPVAALTARENQIGALLKQHLSNKEIAGRLGIEVATVKNHVHNLLDKLRVHSRTDAAHLLRRVIP
jgi:two-component system, NarL family, nitrate/nitrite response regulator NarL